MLVASGRPTHSIVRRDDESVCKHPVVTYALFSASQPLRVQSFPRNRLAAGDIRRAIRSLFLAVLSRHAVSISSQSLVQPASGTPDVDMLSDVCDGNGVLLVLGASRKVDAYSYTMTAAVQDFLQSY